LTKYQTVSPKVQQVLDIIANKEMTFGEYTALFNNASNSTIVTEEEREILTDELIIKLRTLFPTKANRLLGNKSGKPQEFLEEILTEVNTKYDWSSVKNGGKNRTGDHVKAGGDMFRKESEGGFYISYYISYKNSDDWGVAISYKQKSADKPPYIQVGKRQVRKDTEFEPYLEDFPIETRLDAIDIFKSFLPEIVEER